MAAGRVSLEDFLIRTAEETHGQGATEGHESETAAQPHRATVQQLSREARACGRNGNSPQLPWKCYSAGCC